MSDFLLEIGLEEIPAGWFAPPVDLRGNVASILRGLLEQERIAEGAPEVHSTPRRLVAHAPVLPRQADRTVRVFGPPLSASRDPSGAWTKAAQGFAAKVGASPEALEAFPKDPQKPGDLYLAHQRLEGGRKAVDVLPVAIASLLRRLPFPKRMSWDAWLEDGKGSLPFGRPVRWIVALLDGEVVPFTIFTQEAEGRGEPLVKSGASSRGHRFLPKEAPGVPFRVRSYTELETGLRERYVLLDRDERLARIGGALAPLGKTASAHPLVSEWVELVEYPSVVLGRIPSDFRALPTEVLETVLVHHQRYIPLLGGGGGARFAAVVNGEGNESAIVRGMERVVIARLRDAAFFFAEDMKKPLEERVKDLAGVTFHQELGTYLDKTERMVALVDAMGADMGVLTKPEHDAARDAARLAKADLTTLMVREFPELQGVMGAIYLKAQGNPWENVIRAVRFHYHPLSLDESSPPASLLTGSDATVFGAVSLADKLDTLAGYFGLVLEPTGSSDPFGLRRAAQGALRVLLDFWQADLAEKRPNLESLISAAVGNYRGLKRAGSETAESLKRFFLDRFEGVLVARGFPQEEVLAVLLSPGVSPLQDPYDTLVRLKALHLVRGSAKDDFEHLAVAFKRAKNILSQGEAKEIEPALFQEEAERQLHRAVVGLNRQNGSYEERLRALASLRSPVDTFFDKVLVMAEDERVRANRLGLLKEALSLFYRIADISKLGG